MWEKSCRLLSVCVYGWPSSLCCVCVCVVIRHRAGISEAVKQREKSLLLSLWINEQSFTLQLKMKRMQRCTFPLLWPEPRRNHATDIYRSALLWTKVKQMWEITKFYQTVTWHHWHLYSKARQPREDEIWHYRSLWLFYKALNCNVTIIICVRKQQKRERSEG